MARVSYVDVSAGLEDKFWRSLTPQDRFTFSRITRKVAFFSRKRKKGLTQRSMLPQVSSLWSNLSNYEKNYWSNAGAQCNLSGWRLFVQDTCARIVNGLSGVATPSLLHQSWVGQLHIESPATELKIVQLHPHFYWVSRKVPGTKNMFSPVLVAEDLSLPFKLSINYASNLHVVSTNHFAKFYARFWHSYQGADLYTDLTIPLDYITNWKRSEVTLTSLIGYYIRYDLYLWISGLRGDLFFDNIKAEHSGQNWARDPFCNDINQGFTKAFYQIPKHWAAVILPKGSWYESIYKDF